MSASVWVIRLEDKEAARSGLSLPDARKVVAQRLKVAPGTLENARRGRLKERPRTLAEMAKGAWIRELEREIQALSHEVQILRASGVAPDENEVLKAETLLAKAKQIIRGT